MKKPANLRKIEICWLFFNGSKYFIISFDRMSKKESIFEEESMKRKLLTAFLCSSMLLNGIPVTVLAQEVETGIQTETAIIHSGTIGTAQWSIDSNGVLTVGEGEFENHDESYQFPWVPYLDDVTRVDGTAHFKLIGSARYTFSKGYYLGNNPITSMDLSGWDTSAVTDMGRMFYDCVSLTQLDLNGWDTSAVTYMDDMFCDCSSLTELDLSGWDTSAVTYMGGMFFDCSSLTQLDLSGWDTSAVTYMDNMFIECTALSKIRYSQSAINILSQLPLQDGWYQDNEGPVSIANLPVVESGKTALLTRSKSSVSMHRLYNPNSGEHFYTAADNEKNHLVSVGWKYEGEGWKAPEKSNDPVYRLYNPNAGDHHYTLNEKEKDALVKLGWNYEGIGWYSDENKTVPLYREYNPNAKAGSHNYTPNKAEHNFLTSNGWKDEGIAWYGLK